MIKRLSLLLAAMFVASMMFVAPVFATGDNDWNNNGDDDDRCWVHDNNNNHDDDDFRIFGGGNGDFEQEFEGPEIEFGGENETNCEQAVQQAAAASSSWYGSW